MDILNIEDMRQVRSCEGFCTWVDEIVRQIIKIDGDKEYLRSSSDRKAKCFRDEVMPLERFIRMSDDFKSDTMVQLHLDSRNYDATFKWIDGTLKLEITCAKDGHQDMLRMKELNEKGRVDAYTRIEVTGTKNTGHRVNIPNIAHSIEEIVGSALSYIGQRLASKIEKDYEAGTSLLISFDDYLAKDDNNLEGLISELLLPYEQHPFDRVIIQGTSGVFYAQ